LRIAVILTGGIEVLAGAGCVGRAAIAFFMKMKTELAVGLQALNHARDLHAATGGGDFQPTIRRVALSWR
jgi:hypothetical protein